jgi:hypothetical protein
MRIIVTIGGGVEGKVTSLFQEETFLIQTSVIGVVLNGEILKYFRGESV